ncbi:MAG: hypothetical protein COX79_00725 [Candidatus Levybacteria bacterium CG_4_10_14_0_2_um_filter_36_16]|nr:MAG: hypothetical protein AUK12_02000 [Candidatus Levybacteria bacterium CG2_30_37_29]PIR78916.1 MAG: hypothetical protein COU26_04025 [Candidatus Levybacteria bacterium CG10_big_fil_rev_8_21_14_0_10_36_30]PIZ97845.1 MAG: hypothetical protein COX79_00725 [Candidatus Levybacteria bacterium CG_4_10_14_0_2_um_filter_36_16]
MRKKNKSLGGVIAAGSALAGAALGAAAVILSDKKNQEKIKKTVDDISREAVVIGKNIKKKAEEFTKTPVSPVSKTPVKKKTSRKPTSSAKN